jgi:hypothetical protein
MGYASALSAASSTDTSETACAWVSTWLSIFGSYFLYGAGETAYSSSSMAGSTIRSTVHATGYPDLDAGLGLLAGLDMLLVLLQRQLILCLCLDLSTLLLS